MEQLLQDDMIKYQLIAGNSRELILFFDREGRITDHNAMAGKELGFHQKKEDMRIQDIFKNSFQLEKHGLKILNSLDQSAETVAYRKNQTCFPVRLKVSVYEGEEQYLGLCVAEDLTEYKEQQLRLGQMRADLDALSRNRNRIVANITHELRTPLNGILGLSNNLLDTGLTSGQLETVQLIKRCCDNMDSIVNDLLDYAKLENDKMELEQREFCFCDFINSLLEFNKPRINDKGLKLLFSVADDIPERVIGDEYRLTQILNNLLSNAVKFTAAGYIMLEVAKIFHTNQYVELFFMVIDTGIGISLEEKDRLFQSFSQVDGSISRRFGGTGLGLAISKKLIEAMGGTINVDSEKGKGSIFSFSIYLGLPDGGQNTVYCQDSETIKNGVNIYRRLADTNTVEDGMHEITSMEYIDRLLKEAGNAREEAPEALTRRELFRSISSALEKISICIEMERWDRAEELAYHIRKQLPSEFGDITKIVFRLLLALRKENYDVSVEMMNELKALMDEG